MKKTRRPLSFQRLSRILFAGAATAFLAASLYAQGAKPEPDVLEFNDGERLIGHLVSAAGGKVTFHSDAAGDVTVDWAAVKSLKSSSKFAVVSKGEVLNKHTDLTKIPQGTVSVADQKVTVDPGNGAAPEVTPVASTANVVPQPNFLGAFKRPKFDEDWHGGASFGLDIVRATQKSRNITAGVAMSRTVSSESWIDPRYRTTFDLNLAEGNLDQKGQPSIKTDVIHGNVEQDIYASKRLFYFGSADFLHSYSQGMKLQQAYTGGLGFVALKDEHQELDLKAGISYVEQMFEPTPGTTPPYTKPSQSLIGASVGELYTRSFHHGIALHQGLTFIPAFNNSSAWTMNTFLNVNLPVGKRLGVTFGGIDAYVNQPPASFNKNSLEVFMQLAYKIN